ncbi:NAD(P)/FAD-dependent oxidoreductase [Flavobacterium pectinovorum]|uniref:NAD(P)/FAD-dependent oxidoreductase n=2 Tax=Flavobacterium pectinovorum TaxID=29533 RepID=A0A502F670_9FLAO|nr:NAD(P)/FAD-dependent oxidoreductase [Flavobacterium pectinovorum]
MNTDSKKFDVIIIGGSYSGLAAAMALGRALKHVLIIDSGQPCNAQTPYSHNFLTQDGNTPAAIASLGKQQVEKYDNVKFLNGFASKGKKNDKGFEILMETGETFEALKLIFATGIKDVMPQIEGFSECWGISVLHCPYCHGYEVRNTRTGILGNGDYAFELAKMISNWTSALTIYTNGVSTITNEQLARLKSHNITIVEKEIKKLEHIEGHIQNIVFRDGTKSLLNTMYSPRPFIQRCTIPESLGCAITEDGYIKINSFQETTIEGIYASGDNTSRVRTVANAVAMGTAAGMAASKKLILEQF